MSLKNKLLEKSNIFKLYKDNVEKEKLSDEALIKELEKENIELDNFKKQYGSLVKRCHKDYLYFVDRYNASYAGVFGFEKVTIKYKLK